MGIQTDNLRLDPKSFQAIADLAYSECGLILSQDKATMIQSRLRPRLRALQISDFETYSNFLGSEEGQSERPELISALTTNVSHFFRESHHFDILCKSVLDRSIEMLRSGGKLRIWSAGCSNGQEACSAAISLLEHAPEVADLDVKILGTDIDRKVVNFARQGCYPAPFLSNVPEPIVERYFTCESSGSENLYRVKPIISGMVTYNPLNLLSSWPMRGKFDVIFCRNVVIYFDAETQKKLWPRFREKLVSGGFLFLGHSERIAAPEQYQFKTAGPTSYQPA